MPTKINIEKTFEIISNRLDKLEKEQKKFIQILENIKYSLKQINNGEQQIK